VGQKEWSRSGKFWVIGSIVIAAIAIEIAGVIYGWPVIRTAGYRQLVDKYAQAAPVTGNRGRDRQTEWHFEHRLSGDRWVHIEADGFMDVVKVRYGQEAQLHNLYKYVDYSSPIAIRIDGDILYVYWGEALIHSDYWLLAYDLANDREIDRRRVDPRDITGR
jgi:hypothetical protein